MNKKILMAALALPVAFAACTDDVVVNESVSNQTYVEGDKIHLSENFVLGGGYDDAVNSRGAWHSASGEGTNWYWIPKNEANESLNDFSKGLDGYTRDAIGLCYVGGNEILTNYKFDHDGWIQWGEEMENIPYQCVEGVRYYSRNYLRFNGLVENSAVIESIKGDTYYQSVKGTLSSPISSKIETLDEDVKIKELNLTRGIFKTEEKTIFKGDYVAYYPWTNAMLEAGNLTATSPVQMVYESGDYKERFNALNKYTFAAGWVGNIDGGTEAAEMSLTNVTKLLTLKLYGIEKGDNKIVLLDPAGNFIHKMELTTEQVKAKNFNGTATEKSQTIMIDFDTDVENYCSHPTQGAQKHTTIYVPMFETTVPVGTYVLVINSETGDTKKYKTTKAVEFDNSKLATNLTATCVSLSDFEYDVVTNEEELIAANKNDSEKDILLLGEVELSKNNTEIVKNLVGYIDGVEVGSLTLPAEDYKYTIYATDMTFDCNVTVEAPGCCHTGSALLNLENITLNENRIIDNHSYVEFDTENQSKNYIYGTLNNEPYVYPDEEGLSYTVVEPEIIVHPLASVYVYGKLNNKDANDVEGNNIQSLITIMSDSEGTGTQKKDGEISVVGEGTLTNDAVIENYGTMSNQTGVTANIKNNEGATYVLKIGGQLTGALLKNADNRRCDFIAEVDNAADSRWSTAWSQGLANIIKIVAEQNSEYTSTLDYVYPFQFTLNNGEVMTVNNKNVQVVVENPSVVFVGEKKSDAVSEFTPVNATIGRLLINNTGKTSVNFTKGKNNDGTYKTIEPLQLKVDNSTWAGNECAAGDAENAINVLKGTFQHNKYGYAGKSALKNIRLSVVGNFDVTSEYVEYAFLSQTGALKAAKTGKITLEEDSYFSIAGEIISADAQGDEEHGIFVEERVKGDLTKGNITVNEDSYMQIAGDAVINVTLNVVNNGTMKWISRTGTKSPGVIYCAAFTASQPSNWVNGTPTLK